MFAKTFLSIWRLDNPMAMLDEIGRLEGSVRKHLALGDCLAKDSLRCPACGGMTSKVKSSIGHNIYRNVIGADLEGSKVHTGWMCMTCKSSIFLSTQELVGKDVLSMTLMNSGRPVFRLTFGASAYETMIDMYRVVIHMLDAMREHPMYQVIAQYHMSYIQERILTLRELISGFSPDCLGHDDKLAEVSKVYQGCRIYLDGWEPDLG